MDEVGRGTSVRDGLAIAFAVVHHLYFKNNCRALFATHFHELTDMLGCTLDHRGAGVFRKVGFFCTDVEETEVRLAIAVSEARVKRFIAWHLCIFPPATARCEQGKPRAQSSPAGRHAPFCGCCCTRSDFPPER
jgi:MutS domain V